MIPTNRSWLRRYSVAVLAPVLAIAVKEALGPIIVPSPYLTFYAAVLVSARYGGLGPGLVTVLFSAVLGDVLYLPPLVGERGLDTITAFRVFLFTLLAAAITWLISRRRRRDAVIAESEARLRRMFESEMIGIIAWGPDGSIDEANDRFLDMIGYTRSDLEQGCIGWRDLTPQRYTALDDEAVRQVLASGSCTPYEKEFVRKDGRRIAVFIGAAATSEARDHGVSFILDISERKRTETALREAKEQLETRVAERTARLREANARLLGELEERARVEEALRESEERHRQISALTSDYAYRFAVDADGQVRFDWSTGAFTRITGFKAGDFNDIGSIMRLIHRDDLPALVDRTQRLLQGEAVTTEFRMRTASGEYRWLSDHGQPIWDEDEQRVVRVIGAARDITESKLAHEALRESERRFALAVGGANDGIWDWNLETDRVYLSPRWKAILGHGIDEIGDDPQDWVSRVHPDDADRVANDVSLYLLGRTPTFRCDYRLRHKDGSYVWVLSRGLAVRDPSGKATRMAGSLTDMTQRHKAEEEARRRQGELAHAQRLSTIGEMAAGLAHELNQPLAAIVSFARGCERRIHGGDVRSEDLLYAIDQVARQALRGGEILHRYRSFARSGGERRQWVDVNALTGEVAQLAKYTNDNDRTAIRLDLDPKLPSVRADSVQIEQVLVNLIRNGMEASQSAGDGNLCVRTMAKNGGIEVEVQDSGPGIPDDLRERIFDAFFTTKSEGLGMGLSISRSIIDAHGGRLWSTPNPHGTTFHFTLPREPPD